MSEMSYIPARISLTVVIRIAVAPRDESVLATRKYTFREYDSVEILYVAGNPTFPY